MGVFMLLFCLLVTSKSLNAQIGNPAAVSVTIDSNGVTSSHFIYKDSAAKGFIPRRLNNNPVPRQNRIQTEAITVTVNTIGATCGQNNGTILAQATGGVAPYTYQLDNGPIYNAGNFPFKPGGTYQLKVTDATNASVTQPVTITNTNDQPVLYFDRNSIQRTSSCLSSDASVTLTVSGGLPPYQFSKDGVNYQTSPTIGNLYNGMYGFFVRDANGCVSYLSGFGLVGLLQTPGCNSGGIGYSHSFGVCRNEGQITITAFGPDQPYTFSLDGVNYQSSNHFTNLPSGIYPIYYKSASGLVNVFAITIYQICTIEITYVDVTASCGQSDGMLTVTAINGTAPYQYTIDGFNYQSSNVFANLAAGNYYITARDAGGITYSSYARVYDRCPEITLSATGQTCALNDGTITASPTNGTAPYQYSKDGVNFQTSPVFTGLAPAPYTITMRDALGFTTTATIIVPNYCIGIIYTSNASTCGNNNGTLIINASNGVTPYLYSIDGVNFQVSNLFTNLLAGNYTVTVKDIMGHSASIPATVTNIPGPQFTTTINPATCPDINGSITVLATGGTLPYTYQLNTGGFQPSNVFNGLAQGSYIVTVLDANSCYVSAIIPVNFNCPQLSLTSINESCNSSNGSITATATGGTAPYLYSIDGINFLTNNVFTGLAASNYTITVKDALNTINTSTTTILNSCPQVSVNVLPSTCSLSNGSITATGSNGSVPYQYSIDGINFQSSGVFNNLLARSYTVTIKDANGLLNSTTAIVNNIAGPAIILSATPATCFNNDGTVTVTGSGGTAPYQSSKDGINYQANGQFGQLGSGSNLFFIKDANGCSSSQGITVPLADNLTLSGGNNIPLTVCEGKTITLPAASNGTIITWTPTTSLSNNTILNPVASPVISTRYYILSELGICSKKDSVDVVVLPAPVANAGSGGTICFGNNFQLNAPIGLQYAWSPALYLDNTAIHNPLVTRPARDIQYSLAVTDMNGCSSLSLATVSVIVTPAIKLFAGRDTSIVMNEPFQLAATDINNSGIISYTWSPATGLDDYRKKNPVTIIDRNIVYRVTGVTAAGCEGSDDIIVKVYKGPDIYVPSAFTPDNNGRNDELKAIPVGIARFRHFSIFNRGGQRVFYTTDPSIGWDGKFNGLISGTVTYVWMAEGYDGKGNLLRRKGTVTIIR